ncbi:MAG: class I SAM-dependent methyltransferase [Nitriliruptorales bacterium]
MSIPTTGSPLDAEQPDQSDERYTFDRFARQPFYEAVNRSLVELASIESRPRVLDLACGTGAVTRLIVERLRDAREAVVLAIDASREALSVARRNLGGLGTTTVEFVQAHAEELTQTVRRTVGSVDAVFFCNAIHMVDDKEEVVADIGEVLSPDGVFAFNTTFFEGSLPQETLPFYRRWMMHAIRDLRSRHGVMPTRDKVAARRQLSVDEYAALLEGAGLEITEHKLESVDITLEGWLGISEYREFAKGALPGIPLRDAVETLQRTVAEVFDELEIDATPRLWLQVAATPAHAT